MRRCELKDTVFVIAKWEIREPYISLSIIPTYASRTRLLVLAKKKGLGSLLVVTFFILKTRTPPPTTV